MAELGLFGEIPPKPRKAATKAGGATEGDAAMRPAREMAAPGPMAQPQRLGPGFGDELPEVDLVEDLRRASDDGQRESIVLAWFGRKHAEGATAEECSREMGRDCGRFVARLAARGDLEETGMVWPRADGTYSRILRKRGAGGAGGAGGK
jgi:hypothetical protein